MKLYHFTDAKNLPSIRKRGLLPRVGIVHPRAGMVVWLTSRPVQSGDGTTMLRVQLDRFDLRLLCSDPDDDPSPGLFVYRGTIPPSKIDFLEEPIRAAWRRDHPTRPWPEYQDSDEADYFDRWLEAYDFFQA